jgi:peptidoglycan/LPS O-acetylase OafA/YrhL
MGGEQDRARPVLHSLTALRMFAALAVFNFHVSALFSHSGARSLVSHLTWAGPTGVSFFFLLSGFVLTWSRRPTDRRRDFYRRRFARIYPLHLFTWAAAGVLLVLIGLRIPADGAALSAVLLHSWVPTPAVHYAMDTPSWSLSCEAFFYAVFPFVLPLVLRLRAPSRRTLMVMLVGATLALTAIGAAADRLIAPAGTVYFPEYFPPARLVEFVLGMLLALEVEAGRWPRISVPVAGGLAVTSFLVMGALPDPRLRIVVTLVPYALLIGAAAQAERTGVRAPRLLTRPWAVRLGQWSFAFYLIHGLVFVALLHVEGRRPLGTGAACLWALAMLVVSLGLSALAFHTVERPLERRLRPGRGMPAHLTRPFVTAALVDPPAGVSSAAVAEPGVA